MSSVLKTVWKNPATSVTQSSESPCFTKVAGPSRNSPLPMDTPSTMTPGPQTPIQLSPRGMGGSGRSARVQGASSSAAVTPADFAMPPSHAVLACVPPSMRPNARARQALATLAHMKTPVRLRSSGMLAALAVLVMDVASAAPNLQNPAGRAGITLDGKWHVIVDPYENGAYNYRREAFDSVPNPAAGYFLDHKPANPSELVEYDFDASPT